MKPDVVVGSPGFSKSRYSTPIWLIVATLLVAKLYGIDLGASQKIAVAGLSVVMSIAGVGLPSGASYFGPITPVFLSVGLPIEAIAILFAVDTVPDMVETVTNVTADLATVAVISRASIQSDGRSRTRAHRLCIHNCRKRNEFTHSEQDSGLTWLGPLVSRPKDPSRSAPVTAARGSRSVVRTGTAGREHDHF